jgi:hypothetical protein
MSEGTPREPGSTYRSSRARAILIRAKYAKTPDDFNDRAIEAAKELLAAVEKAAKDAEYDVKTTEKGISVAMPAASASLVLLRADPRDGILFEYGTPAKIQATDIEYDPVRNVFVGKAETGKGSASGPKKENGGSERGPRNEKAKRRNALTIAAEALAEVLK